MTTHKSAAAAWAKHLTEATRLALLVLVTLLIYRPFVSGPFFGAADALWYHGTLADVREQFWSGTFPSYLGQGERSWNGFPIVQRPGTFLLGLALDVATAGRLQTVTLLHLVIVASALGGAASTYFSLRWLAPGRRWSAAFLAVFYVSCPALLWLPFTGDMYPSFVAIPYLPLCLVGVVRCYRKPGPWAAALLAAPLVMVWMAHAPIGLWMTVILTGSCLAGLVLRRTTWQVIRCWLLAAALFVVLGGWYFASVAALGVDAVGPPGWSAGWSVLSPLGADFAQQVKTNLDAVMPAAFLPVGRPPAGPPDLQLGYPLWLLVVAGVVSVYRAEAAHKALVLTFLAVAPFVLPVPWLTERLWSLLPRPFVISTTLPMVRLWVVLAPVACFAGMLALSRLPRGRVTACVSLAVLLGLCVWGLREAEKFRSWGETKTGTNPNAGAKVLCPESTALYWYAVPRGTRLHSERLNDFTRWCDPALEQRLLRPDGTPLSSALDSVQLRPVEQCPDVRLEDGSLPRRFDRLGASGMVRVRVRPGTRCLLAVRYRTVNFNGHLQCLGARTYRDCWLPPDSEDEETAYVPLWTSGTEETEIEVRMVNGGPVRQGESLVEVLSLSAGPYRPADLEIGLESLIPYRASVTAPEPCLLQTPRLYSRGYEARVNGQPVPTSNSQGMATVALPAGPSRVELRYRGTPVMRAAFWVSATGWLGVFAAVLGAVRRRTTRQPLAPAASETKVAA